MSKFNLKFNLNGIDYKVVDGLVHQVNRGSLNPCYYGEDSTLEEYCRTHDLLLYCRPDSIHTHGHQKGQARVNRTSLKMKAGMPKKEAVPVDVSYKVWLHIERLEDPDTEKEQYEDAIIPVQLAHVRHLVPAEHLVQLIEEVYGGEIDDV